MTIDAKDAKLLLKVIRGDLPVSELQALDILVLDKNGTVTVYNPRQLRISVSLQDLASGLLKQRSQPHTLRSWASFVEAASSIYEFAFKDDSQSDLLLDAIWRLAFGEHIDHKAIQLAERLATL